MAELQGAVDCEEGMRLDKYIADELGALTRSQLKSRLVDARVNGKPVKLSRLVQRGDRYSLVLEDQRDTSFAAESIALSVLYEDEAVIVVDKKQGMVTHPAHGNWSGTLANALLGRLEGARAAGSAPSRAGIVHRLDKDTSGVIIAAKTAEAQEFLAGQFRDRSTRKSYLAIVTGRPPEISGHVDDWLARDPRNRKLFAEAPEGCGKRAWSDYRILASVRGYSLLLLRPRTGRTHQLRVHCRKLACPILGDPLYGRRSARYPGATLMLHAWELRIRLPGREEASVFSAELPPHFADAMRSLGLHLPEQV